jgi:hypothetical protein
MPYRKSSWRKNYSPPNESFIRSIINNIEDGLSAVNGFLGNGEIIGSSWWMWDDLRFDSNAVKAAGIKDPAWATFSGGLAAYWFSPTTQEDLFLNVQMPHSWDGSAIYPHMHWAVTTASSVAGHQVRWGIEYAWANIGSTFPSASTVYASTSFPNEQLDVNKHYLTSFAPITPTTNQDSLSSMMMCRLFRDSTVAGDSFTHGAFLLEFDIHYRMNMVGSRNELTK